MTQPLALIFCERIIAKTQLPTKLESLGYRVHSAVRSEEIFTLAKSLKPLVIIADIATKTKDVCPIISQIRQDPDIAHIPIIAITDPLDPRLEATAREAGANIIVNESAITMHLKQLLDRAIEID
ncbi:MAG: hypothetical protein ACP5MG_11490 [Verrucomicrobiia bacterium]|jgi:CheY-like chemotaxis protein